MMLSYAFFSEKGPRSENEDAVAIWEVVPGLVSLAVADGLGGHSGGKVASEKAVAMFGTAVESGRADLETVLQEIHKALREEQDENPQVRGMATTLSAVVANDTKFEFVHCGDTRIALQRGSGIKRLTVDHSEAQRLLAAGALTKEEYNLYPRKNVLESALGIWGAPRIDTGAFDLLPGDRIIITSDGVHGKVLLREMKAISDQVSTPTEFLDALASEVRRRYPEDNFSAAVLFVA